MHTRAPEGGHRKPMSDLTTALAPELMPPPPKRKPRAKRLAGESAKKRGPPRPYRKVTDDVLCKRTERLTKRMERVKRQHESTRTLLTKYAHERFYRDKEALAQGADAKEDPPTIPPLPSDAC